RRRNPRPGREIVRGPGVRRMSRLLSCPRGHQWREADLGAAPGDFAQCPVCGLAVSPAEPAPPAPPPPDAAPTLLEPATWQPFVAPGSEALPHLEGFTILGEIGRGGMGIVYQARPAGSDRLVAIKVIRKDRLL